MTNSDVLSIISVVAIVLGVILFFKIWRMTNDVKALRDKFDANTNQNSINKAYLLGANEELRNLILDDFFKEMATKFQLDNKNYEQAFKKARTRLGERLSKIGEGMPERLNNLQSGKDFRSFKF